MPLEAARTTSARPLDDQRSPSRRDRSSSPVQRIVRAGSDTEASPSDNGSPFDNPQALMRYMDETQSDPLLPSRQTLDEQRQQERPNRRQLMLNLAPYAAVGCLAGASIGHAIGGERGTFIGNLLGTLGATTFGHNVIIQSQERSEASRIDHPTPLPQSEAIPMVIPVENAVRPSHRKRKLLKRSVMANVIHNPLRRETYGSNMSFTVATDEEIKAFKALEERYKKLPQTKATAIIHDNTQAASKEGNPNEQDVRNLTEQELETLPHADAVLEERQAPPRRDHFLLSEPTLGGALGTSNMSFQNETFAPRQPVHNVNTTHVGVVSAA